MTLFDPGLQPERTELAWRRTALALGAGSLVALRLLPTVFGSPLWAIVGVIGTVASAALWSAARRRYCAVASALAADGERARLPDGLLPAACAVFVAVGGSAGLAIVLERALS